MFSAKFYVDSTRKDSLMLRITNNRKKVEMSMVLKISPDELESALSGSSRNIRLEKMLASWTSQIKDLMLELADKKETDKDAKEIRTILQERLLGEKNKRIDELNGSLDRERKMNDYLMGQK